MYNPPANGLKPDIFKMQPPWSAELLTKALQLGLDFPLPLVREALGILHKDRYVLRVPAGHELTEKGRREAERLRQGI
jgi:Mn-dependent DtxR family transcriptional regulator